MPSRTHWDGEFWPPTLGLTLKMGRYFRDLSIRELAKAAGVSPAQVSRIEAEQVEKPAWDTVIALARALNFNPVLVLSVAGHIPAERALPWLNRLAASRSEDEESNGFKEHLGSILERGVDSPERVRELAMSCLAWPIEEADWDEVQLQAIAASAAERPLDPGLSELTEIWASIDPDRRDRVVAFARDQRDLSKQANGRKRRHEHG